MIMTLILYVLISALHPFYASVTDIVHKENSLQITQRFFIDDMEDTLGKTFNRSVSLSDTSTYTLNDSLLGTYIHSKFQLVADGKKCEFTFLGHELEEDAVWLYLEVKNVPTLSTLSIYNIAMFEIFSDQTNIVHVEQRGTIKSVRLFKGQSSDHVSFIED